MKSDFRRLKVTRLQIVLGIPLLIITVAAIILFLHDIEANRNAASRLKCWGNFTTIGMAMRGYHESHGHFPPPFIPGKDGKPAHSWRVLLLETLDAQAYALYHFDEPWDSPNNRILQDMMPSCYACPADPEGSMRRRTNYFVVVGPNTVFPGTHTVRLGDIKRAHSETILVVEAIRQDIHWMEPNDLMFETMSFKPNDLTKPSISSYHKPGPGVYTVDGAMLWLSGFDTDHLREMLLITNHDQQ